MHVHVHAWCLFGLFRPLNFSVKPDVLVTRFLPFSFLLMVVLYKQRPPKKLGWPPEAIVIINSDLVLTAMIIIAKNIVNVISFVDFQFLSSFRLQISFLGLLPLLNKIHRQLWFLPKGSFIHQHMICNFFSVLLKLIKFCLFRLNFFKLDFTLMHWNIRVCLWVS